MHSTLKLRESDPHDVFTIAPETVPAAWADKVLADITRDAGAVAPDQQPPRGSHAGSAVPAVEPNFRAIPADIHVANDRPAGLPPTRSGAKSKAVVFVFALCSALAAAAWQHYGDAARQVISAWTPPFALTSSPTPEPTGLTGQPDAPAAQVSSEASAADQTPPQNAAAAQPPEAAASAATAPAPDAAQLQSMAHDLATMGQQIELLKATVAELKTGQQATARDVARPSETKSSEIKPLVQNPRPRISALPPRAATAPVRRPMQAYPLQAYPPVQAAAPPLSPQQLPPPALVQPAPPPQLAEPDGEPVVRPPMPLH